MKVLQKSRTKSLRSGNEKQQQRRSGLTSQFKIVELGSETAPKREEDEAALKSIKPNDLHILDKPENPFLKNFKRRFDMQKCSSANNILKATFKNRISLSPIENKQKPPAANPVLIKNPFQLACATPDLELNQKSANHMLDHQGHDHNQVEMVEANEKPQETSINESLSGNESISACSSSSSSRSSSSANSSSCIENDEHNFNCQKKVDNKYPSEPGMFT